VSFLKETKGIDLAGIGTTVPTPRTTA
jgi:hypothetical protein